MLVSASCPDHQRRGARRGPCPGWHCITGEYAVSRLDARDAGARPTQTVLRQKTRKHASARVGDTLVSASFPACRTRLWAPVKGTEGGHGPSRRRQVIVMTPRDREAELPAQRPWAQSVVCKVTVHLPDTSRGMSPMSPGCPSVGLGVLSVSALHQTRLALSGAPPRTASLGALRSVVEAEATGGA